MKTYIRLAVLGAALAACGGCTSLYTIPAGTSASQQPISTSSPYNPPSPDDHHGSSRAR